jgi:hypothetical protein
LRGFEQALVMVDKKKLLKAFAKRALALPAV